MTEEQEERPEERQLSHHYHHWKPADVEQTYTFECSICGERFCQKGRSIH